MSFKLQISIVFNLIFDWDLILHLILGKVVKDLVCKFTTSEGIRENLERLKNTLSVPPTQCL